MHLEHCKNIPKHVGGTGKGKSGKTWNKSCDEPVLKATVAQFHKQRAEDALEFPEAVEEN